MEPRIEALCYGHPEVLEFSTRILDCRPQASGGWGITLEGSFFFPEGGGQPADRGDINGARVLNVQRNDGSLLHLVDRPLTPGPVDCRIDAAWRRRYQEQHTGQHLISAAFWHLARLATVSVHLGTEGTTIDLDCPDLSEETLLAVERQVNEVIRQNRPVVSQEVSAEELPRFPLRKPSALTGRVRLVQIDGLDASVCCGLHLASTGEVGLVHTTGTERMRGQIRTRWVIGMDALNHIRNQRELMEGARRILGIRPDEIPTALERLLSRLQELERQKADLETRHIALLAPHLLQETQASPAGYDTLARSLNDLPEGLFMGVAKTLLQEQGLCFLLLRQQGERLSWALGCGPDLSLDYPLLRRHLLDPLQARGGGRAPLWQGVLSAPERVQELLGLFSNLPPGCVTRIS